MFGLRRFWILAIVVVIVLVVILMSQVLSLFGIGGNTYSSPYDESSSHSGNPGDSNNPATSPMDAGGNELIIAANTTTGPMVDKLASAYKAIRPGIKIKVQKGGTSMVLTSVGMNIADLGVTTAEPTTDQLKKYPELKKVLIAYDHLDHPIYLLTNGQTDNVENDFINYALSPESEEFIRNAGMKNLQ